MRPVRLAYLLTASAGAALAISACGAKQGAEGEECFPNGTCNAGLECAPVNDRTICLDPNNPGSGGSNSDGSGGTSTGDLWAECFACGDDECPDEAAACDDEPGCRDVMTCQLECGTDAACLGDCDRSELTEDGVVAMGEFLTCTTTTCVDECTPELPGSGGTSGTGGDEGSGGTSTGTGGDGGEEGSGGDPGSGGSTGGDNLILNGDFSDGDLYWNLDLNAGSYGSYSDDDELCIYNSGTDELAVSLGFPSSPTDAFDLEAGVTYLFSFDAEGAATLEAKVGLAVDPFTEIEANDEVLSNTVQTYSYAISVSADAEDVGIVFNAVLDAYGVGYACFDNISFAPQ